MLHKLIMQSSFRGKNDRKENNEILAVGLRTDQRNNVFSGQAMMFDALVGFLQGRNFRISVVNLASKYTNIQVGKFSIKRTLEYFGIIVKSIPKLYKFRGRQLYITTAQTRAGFFRDFVFINLAYLLGYRILMQQFGSNFESFYCSLSPIWKYLVRKTFEKASVIVVEGELTKRQFSMLQDFERKVVPITNGLPERNLLCTGAGKTYVRGQTFNLLFLSYMIESKGYWDVLKAVRILVRDYQKDVRCVFAGGFKHSVDAEMHANELDAERAFKQYIADNGLESYVTYHRGLMGREKARAFMGAHAFLLPSYFKFEGQPVSVLEAMAYGAVPIVTNHRMIPDMVTADVGLFVDAKSPEDIARKILCLMENPDEYHRLSQAGVARFLANYTLEKYCDNMLQVITGKMSRKNV